MRSDAAALHALVGAYVMDAVPDADRVAFERHLSGCDPCREEIRGLRETTARLAAAVAIEPRPELRDQTLQAAARVRQLPPMVPAARPAGLSGRLPRWIRAPRLAGVGRSRLLLAAVAAVVVFAAVVVGLSLNVSAMQHRLSATDQHDRAIAAVLGASDARTMKMKVRTGGTATVVMSHQQRELVFTASKLTVLPPTQAYELWLMGPSGDKPAGMLPAAHGGMSGPMVVGGLAPGDQLGLTVEPAAGSPHPTTSPVVLVGLGT
jgi:anti-sigma-K factor RskA